MEEVVINQSEATESAVVTEGVMPPKKQRKPINQQKLQDNLWGWAFCLPLIVGTVWFVYSAFVMALLLSFTNYTLNRGSMTEFLAHFSEHIHPQGAWYWYIDAFTHEIPAVGQAGGNEIGLYLFNTVFYMIGIPIGMVLSMFFAVCMSRDIRGGNLFRVLYYLPVVASTVSVIYTFQILFQDGGVINQLLNIDFRWLAGNDSWNTLLGNDKPGNFMNDPYWCQGFFQKIVVVVMCVWKGLGGTIILYVAGLSGVNESTKEAAQIDGANGWQIFWKVTMPDLYPVIFYNIVTAVIGGMQIYMEPELLFAARAYYTSGYVSLIWGYGIADGQQAHGAALGMILAVIIFILTMFQFYLDSRRKD